MANNAPQSVMITLDRLPPSLNTYLHMNWKKRYNLQKIFDQIMKVEWVVHGRFVFTNPVKLYYILSFPDTQKRYRDRDNYIGGTKPITDALKHTFLFRDDADWIKDIQIKFVTGKEQTTILIVEEAKDERCEPGTGSQTG